MTAMTQLSFSSEKFLPKTVYVTYIASTPEKVCGSFAMRMPDGRYDIKGKVIEWDPPRRLSVTWEVDFEEFRELPESLVTYDIEPMGGSVKLTMTEAHRWDVPDAILAGGRQGWPL